LQVEIKVVKICRLLSGRIVRKTLVAGNWKMNGSRESVAGLVTAIRAAGEFQCDVLLLPPTIFLQQVSDLLQGSTLSLGAQNVDWRESGAFTGETSAAMAKEFGCQFALVGHSERRTLFGESDADVAAKFETICAQGLTPILCIGETLAERQAGSTLDVVGRQVSAVIDEVGATTFARGVVAYEPIWAIGTGETATPQMAGEVHAGIRGIVGQTDSALADGMRILYGGSVNAGNAAGLMAQPDIDGALVGGASLKSDDFVAICRATEAS
jgi:triosephosphate isomerase (TIM)